MVIITTIMEERREVILLEENVLISFLRKFDENPFVVKVNGREYLIGEGEPAFTVKFQKSIPLSELIRR